MQETVYRPKSAPNSRVSGHPGSGCINIWIEPELDDKTLLDGGVFARAKLVNKTLCQIILPRPILGVASPTGTRSDGRATRVMKL